MEYLKINYKLSENVGIIKMDYSKNFNAMDTQMVNELLDALDRAEKDEEVKVVIIRGGEKAFSAGGDLIAFKDSVVTNEYTEFEDADLIWQVSEKIRRMPKIVLAEVAGVAAGAGASLAFSCDFIFSTEETKYIEAFVNVGLTPDMGGLYMMAKDLGWHKTLEYMILGEPIPANVLHEAGVIYKLVEKEKLSETTMEFAKKLSRGPTLAYGNNKKLLYKAVFKDYEDFHKVEYESSRDLANTEDFKEAILAFAEKRKAEFKGK